MDLPDSSYISDDFSCSDNSVSAIDSDNVDLDFCSNSVDADSISASLNDSFNLADSKNGYKLSIDNSTSIGTDDSDSKFIENRLTTNNSNATYKSIQNAIKEANTATINIYLGEGNFTYSTSGNTSLYGEYNTRLNLNNKNITFIGCGIDKTIIDGANNWMFKISKSNISFINITFANGDNMPLNSTNSSLTFINCSFNDNYGFRGGVLNTADTNLTIVACLFYNNYASKGGVLHSVNDTLIIESSIFENNTAECGGALRLGDTDAYINNSVFYNNSATFPSDWGHGGAMQLIFSNVTINNTRFINNHAECVGGGIGMDSGYLKVFNSLFINNSGNGSAIGEYDPHAVYTYFYNLTNSVIISNDTENYIIYNAHPVANSSYIENNWWGNNRIPFVNTDINAIIVATASIDEYNNILISLNKLNTGENLIGDLPIRTVLLSPEGNFASPVLNISIFDLNISYNGDISTDKINITIDNQLLTLNYNVSKENVNLSLDSFAAYLGHEMTINSYVYYNDFPITQGYVNFYIGNDLVSISKITNGIASLTITPDALVNSNFTAYYLGDDVYNDNGISVDYNVSRYVVDMEYVSTNISLCIQITINRAIDGDIINLGDNCNFTDLANIMVNKSVIISAGENTSLSNSLDADSIFYIVSLSEGGPNEVIFTNLSVEFSNNDSKFVVANSDDVGEFSCIAAINITNCTFTTKDDIYSDDILILDVNSDNLIFKPTNPIIVLNNTLVSGMTPFSISSNLTDIVISEFGLVVSSISIDSIDASNVYLSLNDINSNPIADATINYTIDDISYEIATNSTGQAVLSNLNASTVFIFYGGNESYSASNATVKFTPSALETSIIEYNNISTTCIANTGLRTGEWFIINLTDSYANKLANKSIQIGFNGKVYDRITDENGSAKLQVNLAAAGRYTFAVAFLGDDEYSSSFIVAKITVVKNNVSLQAPTVKVKASATKYLNTTLKTASGILLINKTVTFAVNGKTYTGKTNSNGFVKVKVSLTTKKTYTYTVKFAGDNQNYAATKIAKVTIS